MGIRLSQPGVYTFLYTHLVRLRQISPWDGGGGEGCMWNKRAPTRLQNQGRYQSFTGRHSESPAAILVH